MDELTFDISTLHCWIAIKSQQPIQGLVLIFFHVKKLPHWTVFDEYATIVLLIRGQKIVIPAVRESIRMQSFLVMVLVMMKDVLMIMLMITKYPIQLQGE